MMNEPTSSATTPKISRNVLKNERLSFRLLWLSAVMSLPLITSMFLVPGSDFSAVRMLATTSFWLTPPAAFTSIAWNCPGVPRRRVAVAGWKAAMVAPSRLLVLPNFTMPESV